MVRQGSAQVPCQSGTQFHGPAQPICNSLQMRPQSIDDYRDMLSPDELKFVLQKIINFLTPQIYGSSKQTALKVLKYVEEYHHKASTTEVEYMNPNTVESHVRSAIGMLKGYEALQSSKLVKSSPSVGVMIPTPGMLHNSHSNMMSPDSANGFNDPEASSSALSSSSSTTGILEPDASGSSMTMLGGTFHTAKGSLSNSGQTFHDFSNRDSKKCSVSPSNSRRNISASMTGPTAASLMISTHGSDCTDGQYTAIESGGRCAGFSAVDSSASQQIMLQRQHVGEPVTCLLQDVGKQIRSGFRPTIQQRSFAYDNGSGVYPFEKGFSQMVTDSASPVSYLSDGKFGLPPRLPQQRFDHHQQISLVQAGGWSDLTTSYPTVSRSFHGHELAVGSMSITQNFNQSAKEDLSRLHLQHQKPCHCQQQPLFIPQSQLHKLSDEPTQVIQKTETCVQLPLSTDDRNHVSHEAQLNCQNFHPEVSRPLQLEEFPLQVQPNLYEACTMGVQSPLVEQDVLSTASSHHMIPLQQNQHVVDTQKRVNGLPIRVGEEMTVRDRQCAESEDKASFPGDSPLFHRVQEVLSPGNSGHVDPECYNISSEGSTSSRAISLRTTESKPNSEIAFDGAGSGISECMRLRQLFFALRHGRSCGNAGNCPNRSCENARKLWLHVERCARLDCLTRFCPESKQVIAHSRKCTNPACLVCGPSMNWKPWNKAVACLEPSCLVSIPMVGNSKTSKIGDANAILFESSQIVENKEDSQSSPKRLKLESVSDPVIPSGVNPCISLIANNDSHVPMDLQPEGLPSTGMAIKSRLPEVKVENCASSASPHTQLQMEMDIIDADRNQMPDTRPLILCDSAVIGNTQIVKHDLDMQANQENQAPPSEFAAKVKSGKPKIKGSVRSLISCDAAVIVKQEIVKHDLDMQCNQENRAKRSESAAEVHSGKPNIKGDVRPLISCGSAVISKQETVEHEQDMQANQENGDHLSESAADVKSGKPKIKCVSLTELFTPEQVREHITGLRQWVGQSKAKAVKNQAMQCTMSENSCQLCAVESLTFEPPPMYCFPCGARIKKNNMYYTVGVGYTRYYFCLPCYNGSRGGEVMVGTTTIPKSKLEKKRNDEVATEAWVQCDKCQSWQHQICALFNGRRNDNGQAEYTCPNCYIQEVESGEREPLPHSAVLGAKDLPRTLLSDHIEQRLFRILKKEKLDRAQQEGKSYDEVPGVEGIVVRVVSSVDKKLEVKPRLREIFTEENYPVEFPYKSKVILLFQKIEGVEVCLFGIYVQEFGSECPLPNQRRVYLAYLDSVKYFRPDVRAVTGEALRTFVYHEILIAYLEYCKKRGFSSCYIWACPPLSGEDYIMYCHPEIQKTPKSDKLRGWYLSMLKKAISEGIVVELTNLYDHFFQSTGECKAKVTAARLPNFDGDYWPGAAEEIINLLNQEKEGGEVINRGKTKKIITKRALKAAGQSDLSSNECKDLVLMQRLGETIGKLREDFVVVHLTYSCTHCRVLMVSGNRWVCKRCPKFQLCDKCYEAEQELEVRDRHPAKLKEQHALFPVSITDVPEDTKDKDEIIMSEFFDTRQAFLSLCQGNHYQYDTLRRAKHSSMMILYHLHNPTAPAFVMTCNVCQIDVESGQGWRCETCPDFDVCDACYQKDGGNNHPHKLTNRKGSRQIHAVQLKKILRLLAHASQCRLPACQHPKCRAIKALFCHGKQCKVRVAGGCAHCKRMWQYIQLHSRVCKDPDCEVPRCRDLREYLRLIQQQSDSRRRAAVMEMMRLRSGEAT